MSLSRRASKPGTAARLGGSLRVELRGLEPLTYSMRTRPPRGWFEAVSFVPLNKATSAR